MNRKGSTARALVAAFMFVLGLPPRGTAQEVHPVREALHLADGRAIYQRACAACHGRRGDGKGEAADALDPRPRDFTPGVFKFRSTESGVLPTDDDLVKTVSRGVPGTKMPEWRKHLTPGEIENVVKYVKTFTDRFVEEPIEPDAIIRIPKKIPADAETTARGKIVFEEGKCWECHGRYGRGDGEKAGELRDDPGFPIRPANLTRGRFKSGPTDEDLFRTIQTGLDGTPMPSYEGVLSEEQTWCLVYYIRTLKKQRRVWNYLLGDVP